MRRSGVAPGGGSGDPRARLLAAAAALAALLARLPFAARRMWDHDSVQLALGVERFDLAAHQPHPPGYPLYVGLLKLLAAVGVSPLHGMVGLSMVAAAAGAAWVVLLTLRLSGGEASPAGASGAGARASSQALGAAALAAALYVTSPVLWFYGELPLVYAVEGAMCVGVAWAVLGMGEGRGPFLLACALFALVAGVRPSTGVLLAPLFLAGVVAARRRGRLPWRRLGAGALLGGALVAAWLVPLLAASGGLAAYRRVSAEHFGALLPHTSILYGAGWGALVHNTVLLGKWTAEELLPGALVLAVLAVVAPRGLVVGLRLVASRAGWLAAWVLPPVAFFLLFHITKAGYTLVHLPALLVAVALVAAPALGGRPARTALAAGGAALLGAALFLFGSPRRPEEPRWTAIVHNELNRGSIRAYEHELDRVLALIDRFPAAATALVAVELEGGGESGAEGFLYPWHRHLQWYRPESTVLLLVPEEGFALETRGHRPFARLGTEIPLPAGTRDLLFVLAGDPGERLPLPPAAETLYRGDRFLVLRLPVEAGMRIGPFAFTTPASFAAPGAGAGASQAVRGAASLAMTRPPISQPTTWSIPSARMKAVGKPYQFQ